MDPSIEEAYRRLKGIKIEPHILVSMIMKEKDDLATIVIARRKVFVEQIVEFANDIGLKVSEDIVYHMTRNDEEILKTFLKKLYSEGWDKDTIKREIEGLGKKV